MTNDDNIIDSCSIINRLDELQDELESHWEGIKEWDEENLKEFESLDPFEERSIVLREERNELQEALSSWLEDNEDELKALAALDSEGRREFDGWRYGITLIRESYFVEYCEETYGDEWKLPDFVVVDWDKTADNLRSGYIEIEFDGVTYLSQ
jgi:hypothetical protein